MARRTGPLTSGSLQDRVKALVEGWTAPSVTEDEVMEALLQRHREYQRKNKVGRGAGCRTEAVGL